MDESVYELADIIVIESLCTENVMEGGVGVSVDATGIRVDDEAG